MKTAFVLSGGGSKGAFQVGVIQQLVSQGVRPDVIYGTSVGALNAVGYAYAGLTGMSKIWSSIQGRGDILSLNWWKLPWSEGMFSMKPLRRIIENAVQGAPMCDVAVCVNDLFTGRTEYYYNSRMDQDIFRMMVEASASIPGVMEPVSGRFVDGGVREQTPLMQAILDGADRIFVILCNPRVVNMQDTWKPSWPKGLSFIMRALDVMEHDVFVNDIALCSERNKIEGFKNVELHWYAPDTVLYDSLEFNPAKIAQAMALGLEAKELS